MIKDLIVVKKAAAKTTKNIIDGEIINEFA